MRLNHARYFSLMSKKRAIYLVFVCCLLVQGAKAQPFKAYLSAGQQSAAQKDHYAAMHYLGKALELRPDATQAQYLYAEAARQFNAFELAADAYKKVLDRDKKGEYPLALFWLGAVYRSVGDYAAAEDSYRQFLAKYPDGENARLAREALASCQWASSQIPDTYSLKALSKNINSGFSEFAPLMAGDTLYFTSYKFDYKEDTRKPKRKLSKAMMSVKGGRGKLLSKPFNQEEDKHTAHVALSLNKKRLYYTICEFISAADIRCSIYYREKDKRNRWKEPAIKLPNSINAPGYTATQPAVGYDSLLQKEVLYFVSDRPGGKGFLDIWATTIETGDNKFGEPFPLEDINTSGNDVTPFYHTPSQTLYFSCDNRQGFGGYDIFRSHAAADLVALPAPFNSSYNDLYFTCGMDPKSGFLASNRPGTQFLDPALKACCNDIFEFTYVPPPPPVDEPLAGNEPPPLPSVPDFETKQPELPRKLEDFLPLALYFDNDEPDKRTRKTTTRQTYAQTYERYYARKSEYITEYTDPLKEADKEEAEILMDVFFEDKVNKGYEWLLRFSEILHERLVAGDRVEIFIKGFTSPRAQSDYNLSLGRRRISSLRNHFDTYREGLFLSYLKSGQLIITERSFGEATAAAGVSDDLFDLRNSVFSIGAANERRVEIVEIKSQ